MAGNDTFELAGRICVVTGGGSGIGRSIAMAMAGEGARIAVLDLNEAGAQETLRLVREAGGDGLALQCDVSSHASIDAAAHAVREGLGDADVLVNNAGTIRPGALETLSLADWNQVIAVNLTGCLLCSQAFGRPMLARGGGVLVHISSISATEPSTFAGAYSSSKAGVTMLSRLLAAEWGPRGVRSNAVCPGMILTPLVQEIYDQPGAIERRSAAIPSRRIGKPDDIAQAVLFLASHRSSYVNGTEIHVDGGFAQNLMAFVPRASFDRSNF